MRCFVCGKDGQVLVGDVHLCEQHNSKLEFHLKEKEGSPTLILLTLKLEYLWGHKRIYKGKFLNSLPNDQLINIISSSNDNLLKEQASTILEIRGLGIRLNL